MTLMRRGRTLLFVLLAILLPNITFIPASGAVMLATNDFEASLQNVGIVVIAGNNSFLLYENEELSNLIQGVSTSPSAAYPRLRDLPQDKTYGIVFIAGDAVLDSLSSEDIALLSSVAQTNIIFGITGNGAHMRDILNITESSDHADLSGDDSNVAFFTHGLADGNREDLLISLNYSTPEQFFDELFDWATPLLRPSRTGAAVNDGAWNADYTHDMRGSLDGGTYRFIVNGYKLRTDNKNYDWFLVTTSIQSAITSYKKNTGRCGWFTKSMGLKAVVNSSAGATLYDYMPTGTVGSTSRGFSIGGTLTTSQAGITGNYSETYSAPDASITDKSNYVTNTAQWDISFTGPDYTWYPVYKGPASVATNSYQTTPAFIVQTPKDKCVTVTMYPSINQVKDDLTYYVFVLKVKEHYYDWSDVSLPVTLCP